MSKPITTLILTVKRENVVERLHEEYKLYHKPMNSWSPVQPLSELLPVSKDRLSYNHLGDAK